MTSKNVINKIKQIGNVSKLIREPFFINRIYN